MQFCFRLLSFFTLLVLLVSPGFSFEVQKQPLAGILRSRCSEKFRNIHRKKTSVEVEGLTLTQVFSCEYCVVFRNRFCIEDVFSTL